MKITPQTFSQGKLEAARKLARKRKTFLLGWLLLAIPVAVQAQFNYTVTNQTITITGYTGTSSVVDIPSTINGLPVTSIGDYAFEGCGLTTVTIPNSVTTIGAEAFFDCSGLTSVTIPNSVTSIGAHAFTFCYGLTNIMVDPLNLVFSSVDGVLFNQNQTTLVEYPGGKLGGYTIPNSVTSIADSAFAGCFGLTSVTIPNSVTSIGDHAFSYCYSLTSVTIPNSLTTIGGSAFIATSLTSVTIPNSVASIGDEAFEFCDVLTNITVAPLNSAYSGVDGVLFNHSQTILVEFPGGKVGSYMIPNSVTNIGEGAFTGCSSLTSVTIPNSVTTIGGSAFGGTSLTGVTIPDSVTSVGDFAFSGCFNLTNITLGSGVTSIGDYAFSIGNYHGHLSGCPLMNITIPNSVTNIGNWAFAGCFSLTSVTIPNSVISIGDGAFSGTSLTNITVDPLNSAYSGVDGVLFNHSQTTLVEFPGGKVGSYMIPNSVMNIGEGAFAGCYILTDVTIPNSVTSIGDGAFAFCSSLTSVYFQGNAPGFGGINVFDGDNVTIYYLPGTTGWGSTFAGLPTGLWTLPYPLILSSNPRFGVQTNQFGFTVSWATNLNVVVEAATDLANPIWSSVQTNALTNGSFYFSDSQWKNYPARFYRVRSQ